MKQTTWTERIEKEFIQIFKDLIQLKTVNPPGDEILAAEYIHELFQLEGIDSQIVESSPGRANVLAKIPGGRGKPILMISHIDVVADSDRWERPAFEAIEEDGIIHGRGTLDTKQLTASEIITMLMIKRMGIQPNRDVLFIASADEEGGSRYGMGYLSEHYPEWFPESYVVSEGGGFVIKEKGNPYRICASGEKGQCDIEVLIKGESQQEIMLNTCDVMERLSAYESAETLCDISNLFMSAVGAPASYEDKTVKNLWEYMTRNAVVINKFEIVPSNNMEDMKLSISVKSLPGTTEDDVTKLIESLLQGVCCGYRVLSYMNGYESHLENPFTELLQATSNKYDEETPIAPIIALGRTDGRFTKGDVYGYTPTLQDLPFERVLKMVHQDNECITVGSLIYGGKVLSETVITMIEGGRS